MMRPTQPHPYAQRALKLAIIAIVLSGCSLSNRMNNYEARLKTDDGTDWQIFNKRGALLRIERPDGTKIVADDRGYQEPPSLLREAFNLWALKSIGQAVE
jgi:ABC-type uncharacterized transport system auxiliary subunit